MSFISKLNNFFDNHIFGIGDDFKMRDAIVKEFSHVKYWKGFNDYDKYDFIDFSNNNIVEMDRFTKQPRRKHANIASLILEPAIESVTFDLSSSYVQSKPKACFVRTNLWREIRKDSRVVRVFEIARIFLRFDGAVKKPGNVGEARYFMYDDRNSMQFFFVVTDYDHTRNERTIKQTFADTIFHYVAIQYAMKNRPTVFHDIASRKKGNGKQNNQKGVVKVRRFVIDKTEQEEFFAGHFIRKEIKCTAWGVSGHYRHYKDGRVVWVKPYVKGKERNNPKAYTPKTYQFVKKNHIK